MFFPGRQLPFIYFPPRLFIDLNSPSSCTGIWAANSEARPQAERLASSSLRLGAVPAPLSLSHEVLMIPLQLAHPSGPGRYHGCKWSARSNGFYRRRGLTSFLFSLHRQIVRRIKKKNKPNCFDVFSPDAVMLSESKCAQGAEVCGF